MTQKQLEDYLWGAANILRGMIDAADFKQYIFPLLFFISKTHDMRRKNHHWFLTQILEHFFKANK
jgi:type I restriction-modification system DNA methylase subunit